MTQQSDLVWRKSTKSVGGGSCIEVAEGAHWVSIRDTKWAASQDRQPPRPVISLDPVSWADFLGHVARGATEIVVPGLRVQPGPGGVVQFRSTTSPTALEFSADEWNAFVEGVGEFGGTVAAGPLSLRSAGAGR